MIVQVLCKGKSPSSFRVYLQTTGNGYRLKSFKSYEFCSDNNLVPDWDGVRGPGVVWKGNQGGAPNSTETRGLSGSGVGLRREVVTEDNYPKTCLEKKNKKVFLYSTDTCTFGSWTCLYVSITADESGRNPHHYLVGQSNRTYSNHSIKGSLHRIRREPTQSQGTSTKRMVTNNRGTDKLGTPNTPSTLRKLSM